MVNTNIVRIALEAPFSPKSAIFTQSEVFENTQTLNATLFLIVALEPDLAIRMGSRHSLKKGRRAVLMKVYHTDNTGERVECRSI